MKNVLVWMEECRIVDGHLRSCIYDLPRSNYYLVDKGIRSLQKKINKKCHEELELTTNEIEWIEFLKERNVVQVIPESVANCFPEMNEHWTSNFNLYSAIIEVGCDFERVTSILEKMLCRHIVILVNSVEELVPILENHFEETDFKSLQVNLNSHRINPSTAKELFHQFPVISRINTTGDIAYFSGDELESIKKTPLGVPVLLVHKDNYMESENHNVYFNRRIFISKENLVSTDIYSKDQIPLETLRSANLEALFGDIWFSSKNNTDVCSVCEFRRMCIDARVPVKVEEEKYTHTIECIYNPYIAKWKGDSGYKTVQEYMNDKGK